MSNKETGQSIRSFDCFMYVLDRLCDRFIGCPYDALDSLEYIDPQEYYDAGRSPSDALHALKARLSDDRYLTTKEPA